MPQEIAMDKEAVFEAIAESFDRHLADIIEEARASSCAWYPTRVTIFHGLERELAYEAVEVMKAAYPHGAFEFTLSKDLHNDGHYTLNVAFCGE